MILLMAQKYGEHQLRLVVEIPIFTTGFKNIPGGARRISEPPRVGGLVSSNVEVPAPHTRKKWPFLRILVEFGEKFY